MTMQQVTMSEYLKTRYGSFPHCGSCVCQKCLYWWSGRCPEGECYDNKRAKEEPYNKAFPERSPRTQWSNWNLPGEQAHWCRGGTFYPVSYCEHFRIISALHQPLSAEMVSMPNTPTTVTSRNFMRMYMVK